MRKHLSSIRAFFICVATILTLFACQREVEGPVNNQPGIPIDNETVIASVRGIVVDEQDRPLAGATVSGGGHTVTTDRYGVFRFTNITLSKNNGFIKVSRQGYFQGSRSFVTTAGKTQNVRVKLLPKNISGSFTGSSGGTVNLSNGTKLVIPSSGVVDASGNPYNGNVDISMTWIDPTSADLPYTMPGDLRGITTSGEERGLQTFGMIGVEMTGPGGTALKMASGKTAELSFPIPPSLASSAPATIDLWHFDESTGRWKQEGQATKNGNVYTAQVSHFSFWNCDAPFALVDLCMTIVNASNSQPLNNIQVRIKRTSTTNSYGYGRTDSLGNLCGKVPQNEPLILEILDQCNNVVFTQNIGPFASSTTLGTVSATIPPTNSLTISGTLVNCSNSNVTNGAVMIYTSGGHSYSVPVTNGHFSLTLIRCNSTTIDFSVLGIDNTTIQQSIPFTGSASSGTVNTGNIQVCGISAEEFIEYIVDGTPFAYVGPVDEITVWDSLSAGINSFTVRGEEVTNNNVEATRFRFHPTSQSPGAHPLSTQMFSILVNNGNTILLNTILTPNPVVNITTFGPVGTGFIEGNFSVQMNAGGTSASRNVVCNFRVKRQ